MTISEIVEAAAKWQLVVGAFAFVIGMISYGGYARSSLSSSKLRPIPWALGFINCALVLAGSLAALAAANPPVVVAAVLWVWMFLGWASIGIFMGKGFPRKTLPALYQTISPILFVGLAIASTRLFGSDEPEAGWEVLIGESALLLGAIYSVAVVATLVNQFRVYRVAIDRAQGKDLTQTYTIGAIMLSPLLVAVVWIWATVVPDVLSDNGLGTWVGWVCIVVSAVDITRQSIKVLPDYKFTPPAAGTRAS